jgi:hypothetical protein
LQKSIAFTLLFYSNLATQSLISDLHRLSEDHFSLVNALLGPCLRAEMVFALEANAKRLSSSLPFLPTPSSPPLFLVPALLEFPLLLLQAISPKSRLPLSGGANLFILRGQQLHA